MEERYIKDASKLVRAHKVKSKKTLFPIYPSYTLKKDSWTNLIAGLGGTHSKSSHTNYQSLFCMTDSLLHSLWVNNGICRKVVNVVADDCTKNGISISNDIDNEILDMTKKLMLLKNINLADKYRRHYGGSLIIVGVDDGRELWEPIGNYKEVKWLKAYSRTDCYMAQIHLLTNIMSDQYGKPEYYTILPKYTTPFNVHYSRVIEFKGLDVPQQLDNDYRYYWGMSIIEPLWESLKKLGAALENVDALMYEATIGIYKIKDLVKLINECRWDDIKAIINTTDQAKSTINSMLLDSEDSYSRDSLNFAGIKDVVEIFMMMLSGESEITFTRLFGEQQGGLNNEGKSELTTYYDKIDSRQTNELLEPTQKLVDMITLNADHVVTYNKPYQITETQELQNKKTQAEIDAIYMSNGVLDPEECTELRFANGWTYEMRLPDGE